MLHAELKGSRFMSFMSVWMAFNGWMASVTGQDTDAKMLNALASNARLTDAFESLMKGSPQFRGYVAEFSDRWPVLNVKDVRKKLGLDAFQRYSRDELIAKGAAAGVKLQPVAWVENSTPSWEQLLRVIYQVRCNLFHGVKSPQNHRDSELVHLSDRILRTFLAETRCLEWV